MEKLKESDLYPPVKEFLDGLGYDTKAEVRDCDIAATRDGELIVVELKTGFTLNLVYQGIERQRIADGVYLAVPLPKQGYMSSRYNDMLRLCRQLELGLILIGFTSSGKAQLDVALHPHEAKPVRTDKKERLAVIKEHKGRTGSLNTGGVTRRKIITVYKEQALKVAAILEAADGELRAGDIRSLGGSEKTSSILGKNFYGWYEKVKSPGKKINSYRITDKGRAALQEYRDLLE